MADRIQLKAHEREIVGKKVKRLRKEGLLPGHVFGNGDTEHISVATKDFIKAYNQAGETGLIDLKIGDDKTKPVLIREAQYSPVNEELLHVGFYQVNLKEKVTVPVPIVIIGEEAELVHLGEAVVLQTLSEVQIEALPTDLIDQIEIDITPLKAIDDSFSVSDLKVDREKITILAEPEETVVKLAPAVTEEMKKLLEEQEAEAAAAAEEAAAEEGAEGATEGEEGAEGEEGETSEGGEEEKGTEGEGRDQGESGS